MKPRVVSLFAGIGGFDLGFQRAGFEIIAHVEKCKACRKLLGAKFPYAASFDDVLTAGAHNLPPCDVLTFGFPCQDLSVAGRRAGLKGTRSGLFYEATRIAHELKIAWLVFENVPGLLSSDDGRDFQRVLSELDKRGYHGAWRTLDAQHFGLAQRRRRVFGVFTRLDSGAERCAEVLSLADGVCWHPAPRREAWQGVTCDLSPSLSASGRGTSRAGETRGQDCVIPYAPLSSLAPCRTARDSKGERMDVKEPSLVVSYRTAGNCGPFAQGDKTAALNCATDPNQNIVQVQWASGGGKIENDTAQALRAGAETNYQFARIANAVRRLTPRECERLQGFPDDWTAGFPDTTRYKMLGNAVAVPCAEWIARRLIKQL